MMNWPFALWGGDGLDDGKSGDGESEDSDDEGSGDDDDGSKGKSESLTMTQGELTAAIARAASRASRKARKDVRRSLGFDTQEELDAFVHETRRAEESGKDEADKLKQETENERSTLVSDRKKLFEDRIGLAIDRAIILAGTTDEAKVKRIRTLVRSELGDEVDQETLGDDVIDAIEAVKTDIPSMFDTNPKTSQGSGDGAAKDHKLTDKERTEARDKQYRDEFKSKGLIVTQ